MCTCICTCIPHCFCFAREGDCVFPCSISLQKILDIARKLLENVEKDEEYEIEEKVNKLQQLKTVLEM